MKQLFAIIITLIISALPLSAQNATPDSIEHEVLLETTKGNIRVKLYNDTPIHRDNFLKLVKEGFYDGLLFHRIIPDLYKPTSFELIETPPLIEVPSWNI